VKAFLFRTAGNWPDMETDLVLYTNLPRFPKVKVGFRKGTRAEKVNIFDVSRFFCGKVLGIEVPERPRHDGSLLQAAAGASWVGDALAWLGNDAAQIDAAKVEEDLRGTVALLGAGERVLMAFKVGRDTTLMTSRRLIRIDVQGLSGKKVEYLTIPYEAIKAFVVQTAGSFDLDAEMKVWTDIPAYRSFEQDLRAGKADVKGIQALLSDKVLGVAAGAPSSLAERAQGKPLDMFHWLGNNFQQVDPGEAEAFVRSHGVLQAVGEERVLMGFRVGRDVNLLTDKRLLMIDVKGFGKKVEFKTIPYHAIRAYAVQTAGGRFDSDAEVAVWTGVQPPPQTDDGPPQCPGPDCLSIVTFDLRKGRADVGQIQLLLSDVVLGPGGRPSGAFSLLQSAPGRPRGLADFYHYLEDNAEQVDPGVAERMFKEARVLQAGEAVRLAFRLGGDFHIWSSKRFLLIDRRGWFSKSKKKVLYQSIPYKSIKAFAVTSAGLWDTDSELEFWTDMPWLPHYKQDLRRGRVDLRAIMMTIAGELTEGPAPPASLLQGGAPGGVLDWLGANAYEVDAAEATETFRTEKPILLPDEEVLFACKTGRDTTLLTSRRVLRVDVQGFSGKRVHYRSIPYGSVGSFLVRSAGDFDLDSEMVVYTTSASKSSLKQDFQKKEVDIFKVSGILTSAVFRSVIGRK